MWLRASYTVENAVITPLFMLIIIVVMRASCDIHDNLIQRSVNSQFVIQTLSLIHISEPTRRS